MKSGLYRKLFIPAGIFSLALFAACSTNSRYKVLSTFFDGVPEPGSKNISTAVTLADDSAVVASTERKSATVEPVIYFHQVYKERACAQCHDIRRGNSLVEQPPALCNKCHEDFKEKYSVLHGPAASGFCSNCHHPHFSKNEKMLIRSGQDLCLFCHESKDVNKNEIHEDIEESDCWDCHSPHGGDSEFFIY